MFAANRIEKKIVQRSRLRSIIEPPVEPPERGEARVGVRFLGNVGRTPERGSGLVEIVLQQVGLGNSRAHRDLLVARQRTGPMMWQQDLDSFSTATAFEGRRGPCQRGLYGGGRHRPEYT